MLSLMSQGWLKKYRSVSLKPGEAFDMHILVPSQSVQANQEELFPCESVSNNPGPAA